MSKKIISGIFSLLILIPATGALADDVGQKIEDRFDRRGDAINERLDQRGANINDRLDQRGANINDRLDQRGANINERLDARSQRALENGRLGKAARLDRQTHRG